MAFYKVELIIESLGRSPTPTEIGDEVASEIQNRFDDLLVVCFNPAKMSE